ncbi:MAG: hypothetical protein ACOCUV_00715 [bacterium]
MPQLRLLPADKSKTANRDYWPEFLTKATCSLTMYDLYKVLGYDFTADKNNILTEQYYRKLGYHTFFVRYGYKGRRFSRVYGKNLKHAKSRLKPNIKASLFGIELVQ